MAPTFDLIGIVVADMGKSLAFYRRLGLEIPAEADAEGHAEAALPGGLRLAWDAIDVIRSFSPEWTPASGGPAMALAFRCDSPAEVDRVFADLTGAGYAVGRAPWDAFWGQRYATVHDPDGNHVDLFAPLDAS
jgi:catechol 2,3-dioxygenase-like lactoylglutathione lyase family enzyme